MTPNSAYSLVPILQGVDYTPTPIYETIGSTNVEKGKTPPIFALLCTKGGTSGNIQIRLLGDSSAVTIPSMTFKQGVVYYMYLAELVNDNGGDVTFVGYKYSAHPLVF